MPLVGSVSSIFPTRKSSAALAAPSSGSQKTGTPSTSARRISGSDSTGLAWIEADADPGSIPKSRRRLPIARVRDPRAPNLPAEGTGQQRTDYHHYQIGDQRDQGDIEGCLHPKGRMLVAEVLLDQHVGAVRNAHDPAGDDRPAVEPADVQRQEDGGKRLQNPHTSGQLEVDDIHQRIGMGGDQDEEQGADLDDQRHDLGNRRLLPIRSPPPEVLAVDVAAE